MLNSLRRGARARMVRLIDHAVRPRLDARTEQHERWLRAELDRVIDTMHDVDRRGRRDIFQAAERDAALSSARFAYQHFPTATTHQHPHATLEHGIKLAPIDGMALEFGVYSGTTLEIISRLRGGYGPVFGFDSFEGLPEDWRSTFPAATFAVDQVPEVPGAELIVGWFDQTLPGFLDDHPGPVTLLHLDADLYCSTKTVLDLVGPRLVPGSIVIFDEYFNYPGWQQHEHRAWQEYVTRTGTEFVVEAYTVDNEQVAIRITETGHTHPDG